MAILRNNYVLAVPDADGSAAFFIEHLGFTTRWRDPGAWHAVERENFSIHLGSCPDAIHPSKLGDHSYFAYVIVDDVDELHKEFAATGLQLGPPVSKPWGLRELIVQTPDGHRMMFGQVL